MNLDTYQQEMFKPGFEEFFVLPSGSIILRNINKKKGNLISYSSEKKFKDKAVPMWIECRLHLFRDTANNLAFFPLLRCCECQEMEHIEFLPLDQDRVQLENSKCLHSQMADKIVERRGGWNTLWQVDLTEIEVDDVSYKVDIEVDDDFATLREDELFLAVIKIRQKKKTSLLFTINSGTKKPLCNNCTTKHCRCFRLYKTKVERQNPDHQHYWQRLRKEPNEKPQHYDTDSPDSEHFSSFGFNHDKLLLPVNRDAELQKKFDEKRQNNLPLPDSFVPRTGDHKCKCGDKFNPDDIFKISETITVFEENEEYHLYKDVYASRTFGGCKV